MRSLNAVLAGFAAFTTLTASAQLSAQQKPQDTVRDLVRVIDRATRDRSGSRIDETLDVLARQIQRLGERLNDQRDFRYVVKELQDLNQILGQVREARRLGNSRDFFRSLDDLDRAFLETRREFHQTQGRITNRLLDDWYDLAFTYRDLKQSCGHNQDDDDDNGGDYNGNYGQYDIRLSFQGEFGTVSVRFDGRSHQEIYNDCSEFIRGSSMSVNQIKVFGKSYYTGLTYWSNNQLCAIAALNARADDSEAQKVRVRVEGSFAGVPFNVAAPSMRALRQIVNDAGTGLGSISTNDLKVSGSRYYGGLFYWNTDAIKAVILYNVENPRKRLVARGTIGASPFIFTGNETDEIRAQCEDYFHAVFKDGTVNDLKVNGNRKYGGLTYWNASQACMTVGSLAEAQASTNP